jgi:hypothetical protein
MIKYLSVEYFDLSLVLCLKTGVEGLRMVCISANYGSRFGLLL